MDRIVADASVLIKLFLQEEYSDKAYAIRDSYVSNEIELIEPTLLHYEVLSGLRYSTNEKITVEDLKESLTALENYDFKTIPLNEEIIEKIIEVSLRHKISIYDATYVAFAVLYSATLYTADESLLRKVKIKSVKHIKDYKNK